MDTPLLVIAITAIALVPVAAFSGWYARKFVDRLERLEAAAKQGMPYKAINGLEDAMAIMHDVRNTGGDMDRAFDSLIAAANRIKANRAYQDERTTQVTDVLKTLRANPAKYDIDAPSKKRTV